jgi:para-nitrobenzyl esterase
MNKQLLNLGLLAMLGACSTSGAGDVAQAAQPRQLTFLCDGGHAIKVSFAGNGATLDTGSGPVELDQEPAASGISYAGGGHRLRGKGHEMVWTEPSGTESNCRDQEWSMKQPQIEEPPVSLPGTSWRLIHFQSSDDAIGTKVPPRRERYTLAFGADGSLAMQLDCNRGRGTYKAEETGPRGGTLAFGPAVMTRAMCPPDSIDSRLAADLGRVRSYTLRGRVLSLALEADAGIYLWEPEGSSAE